MGGWVSLGGWVGCLVLRQPHRDPPPPPPVAKQRSVHHPIPPLVYHHLPTVVRLDTPPPPPVAWLSPWLPPTVRGVAAGLLFPFDSVVGELVQLLPLVLLVPV